MKIEYTPTPTALRFHQSDAQVRLLMGPVGSGKTHACIEEILMRACRQDPSPKNGVKYSRWAVIRNTYPELKTTTIDAWQSILKPEVFGNVRKDLPMTHRITFKADDGIVDLDVIFLSLDTPDDIRKLLSLRITGVFFNELREINKKVFTTSFERLGRYPAMEDGGPTWSGIIADSNACDTDHWMYKLFEEDVPTGFEIYRYPPALIRTENGYEENKLAENLDNLPNNYYMNMIHGKPEDEIKVQILAEYGYMQDGRSVHKEYNDHLHWAPIELNANPIVELGLGWDFGLTPACAIVQLLPSGRLIVLDELWTEDMALRQFAEHIVLPHLNMHYPFWQKNYVSRHDPADAMGNTGMTCQQILGELGIKSSPAASDNSPERRRDGLTYHLSRLVAGQSGFLLSNKCKQLRKGLAGGFKYARVKVSGDDRFHDKPVKNIFSHICEALEYIAMHYSRDTRYMEKRKEQSSTIAADLVNYAQRIDKMRTNVWQR